MHDPDRGPPDGFVVVAVWKSDEGAYDAIACRSFDLAVEQGRAAPASVEHMIVQTFGSEDSMVAARIAAQDTIHEAQRRAVEMLPELGKAIFDAFTGGKPK